MATLAGMFAGAIIGLVLFGALISWLARKVRPRTPVQQADLFGILVMIPIAALSYAQNGSYEVTLAVGFLFYGLASFVAYPLLRWTRAERKTKGPVR